MIYNLENRTAVFGELVIDLCKEFKASAINDQLIRQIVRSATSVGANYMEANSASSKKDFRNKIYISKKECEETKHWLRMLSKSEKSKIETCRRIWQEANELTLIFGKILSTLNK